MPIALFFPPSGPSTDKPFGPAGNEIDDKQTCLASVDGRSYAQVGGYKAGALKTLQMWCPQAVLASLRHIRY